MAPKLAAYIYSWDLVWGGTDYVLDQLEECGITGINLTANYHAITALSPRGEYPRLFFLPRGGVLFPARPERYGRVKPFVWPDPAVAGAWETGALRATDRGFTVNAWTIGMFQPWMAQDYPFTARVLVTGDRVDTGLCPNSPDVQEYAAHLAVDLADQVPVRRFILEGIGIPEWNYGWVRPRVLAKVSPVGQAMLRMCFCVACQRAASRRGIDAAEVKATALGLLARYGITGETPGPSAAEILAEEAGLRAYSQLGSDGAAAIVRAMSTALKEAGLAARVMAPTAGPERDGSEPGIDDVRDDIAGVNVWTAVMPGDVQETYLPELRRTAPGLELSLVIGPPLAAGAPVNLVTPSFDYSDPVFLERIRRAKKLEPDEISIYHYGLLDDETFRMTYNSVIKS